MVADGGKFEESNMKKQSSVKTSPPPNPPPSRGRVRERGRNEQGFVLVIALLGLLVVTVIGVLAISTSTTEVMVAGNTRLREMNFAGAESGLEISDPAIRFIAFNGALPAYGTYASKRNGGIVSDPDLAEEIRSGIPFDPNDSCNTNPDLNMTLGSMNVTVDIDRMFASPCQGATIEFAGGYEGVGMGGGGSICAYYWVNSMSRSVVGSENMVGGFYRYVTY
jgi:Tfp pilus assembly protein PilX